MLGAKPWLCLENATRICDQYGMHNTLFKLAKPVLHAMDPEDAHDLTLKSLRVGFGPRCNSFQSPALMTKLWGRTFQNPVGLAAGFDKNAAVIAPMLNIGFGFVEVGTVTPKPQDGNPRPRVFRDGVHQAVINRMGFPNGGFEVFRHNIEQYFEKKSRPLGIVGINIGMNKGQENPASDYAYLVSNLGSYADYLTVNISSPNTPGLRNLQARENLLPLLAAIMDARATLTTTQKPPVLVKLAPDLDDTQLKDVAQSLLQSGVDGVILTNTTLARPDFLPENFRKETGGLSGRPLTQKSTDIIRRFFALTQGQLPIIGAGGISSAHDAYEKIKAGASLVQLYSALVFQGPAVVNDILQNLPRLLEQDGFDHISKAIGKSA